MTPDRTVRNPTWLLKTQPETENLELRSSAECRQIPCLKFSFFSFKFRLLAFSATCYETDVVRGFSFSKPYAALCMLEGTLCTEAALSLHLQAARKDVPMKVEKLMSANPASCRADSTVAAVVTTMRDRNCGFVPIVDAAGHVVGVVTARDAVITLAAADRRPSEMSATEAMSAPVSTCQPTESVLSALQRMGDAHVRRLAVVNEQGVLVGVVSISDIVPRAQNVRAGVDRVSYEQVMDALKGICAS